MARAAVMIASLLIAAASAFAEDYLFVVSVTIDTDQLGTPAWQIGDEVWVWDPDPSGGGVYRKMTWHSTPNPTTRMYMTTLEFDAMYEYGQAWIWIELQTKQGDYLVRQSPYTPEVAAGTTDGYVKVTLRRDGTSYVEQVNNTPSEYQGEMKVGGGHGPVDVPDNPFGFYTIGSPECDINGPAYDCQRCDRDDDGVPDCCDPDAPTYDCNKCDLDDDGIVGTCDPDEPCFDETKCDEDCDGIPDAADPDSGFYNPFYGDCDNDGVADICDASSPHFDADQCSLAGGSPGTNPPGLPPLVNCMGDRVGPNGNPCPPCMPVDTCGETPPPPPGPGNDPNPDDPGNDTGPDDDPPDPDSGFDDPGEEPPVPDDECCEALVYWLRQINRGTWENWENTEQIRHFTEQTSARVDQLRVSFNSWAFELWPEYRNAVLAYQQTRLVNDGAFLQDNDEMIANQEQQIVNQALMVGDLDELRNNIEQLNNRLNPEPLGLEAHDVSEQFEDAQTILTPFYQEGEGTWTGAVEAAIPESVNTGWSWPSVLTGDPPVWAFSIPAISIAGYTNPGMDLSVDWTFWTPYRGYVTAVLVFMTSVWCAAFLYQEFRRY